VTATLTGAGTLTRLALRRDRVRLPIWVVGVFAFVAMTTRMSDNFPSQADLVRETQVFSGTAGMRMMGLPVGASVGGYVMLRDLLTLAVLAALMSTLSVVRHTRASEENGRFELVGAAVVGRHAALAAAIVVTIAANIGLALAVALGLVVGGQASVGVIVAGAAIAGVGLAFIGIAAVTSQLASTTRAASGMSAAVLGLSFLAAGVGNVMGEADAAGVSVTSAWPSWVLPIGWAQQTRPFGGNQWWPLGFAVALLAAGLGLATALENRRDSGRGVLAQSRGPAQAGWALHGTVGLAVRLQRGALIGWGVGMLGFGLVLGGLAGEIRDATGAMRDWYAHMGGTDLMVDAFRSSMAQMAAMCVAIYAVQVLLRLRSEEADGPAEPILATATSRWRWVASHAVSALGGAVGLLLVFGIGLGLSSGAVLGDPGTQVRVMVVAVLAQLPAVLAIAAAVIAMVALLPRAAVALSWALVMVSAVLGPLFGPTLKLPQWVQDLSPLTHAPKAPAIPVTAGPLLAMLGVAAILAGVGFVALRRRNLLLPA
jgi:ABC-2 type transport system permease protein